MNLITSTESLHAIIGFLCCVLGIILILWKDPKDSERIPLIAIGVLVGCLMGSLFSSWFYAGFFGAIALVCLGWVAFVCGWIAVIAWDLTHPRDPNDWSDTSS